MTLLGLPDPLLTIIESDASTGTPGGAGGAAGAGNAAAAPTGTAASEVTKIQLNFPSYQMTFNVEASASNPKEAAVTSLFLWGSKPLAIVQPAVETFTDPKQPNDLGYRILELRQPLPAGGYTNSYYKDDFLLTFTHRSTGDTATELEIIPTKK